MINALQAKQISQGVDVIEMMLEDIGGCIDISASNGFNSTSYQFLRQVDDLTVDIIINRLKKLGFECIKEEPSYTRNFIKISW